MDKKTLESALAAPLVAHGFQKKASSWYRQADETLQVVDLQKSAYGLQFYLNLCCVPAGMEVEGMPTPKEHKCPIRIRLTSAFPERREQIEEALDLERTSLDDAQRQDAVARLTSELILPFVNHMKDAATLRQAIGEGIFKRGAVNLAAQKHLGVTEQLSPATPDSSPQTPRG
ncbi:MAG: DUF4304 domain-containing protein [Verrucomicrobiaceae bacterium]|nr:DUF4304 domain-containing protein [Verrucomicrobiaceae bacterium]